MDKNPSRDNARTKEKVSIFQHTDTYSGWDQIQTIFRDRKYTSNQMEAAKLAVFSYCEFVKLKIEFTTEFKWLFWTWLANETLIHSIINRVSAVFITLFLVVIHNWNE